MQVIVAERGPLLLVMNLSPTQDVEDLKVSLPSSMHSCPGQQVIDHCCSDHPHFPRCWED